MGKLVNILSGVLILLTIISVFIRWFLSVDIIGGDWPFYYNEMLGDFSFIPHLWVSQGGIGLGGVNVNFGFFSYENTIIDVFVNILGLPWHIVYRIFWFGLFVVQSIFSITFLIRRIFKKPSVLQIILAILIYVANSYILLIVGGGQMGIALAYSIAPLIIGIFIRTIHNAKFTLRDSALGGLTLALQLIFDLRIAYVTMLGALGYTIFYYFFIHKSNLKLLSIYYSLVAIVVLGLHAFWIVPFLLFKLLSVPQGLTSVEGFEFFSFAPFPQSLSLLHPNWPENVFGKIYFMRPEFVLLPILGFGSLLFIKKNNKALLFFALLALLGVFLAKGVNQPLGEINRLLFENVLGMSMFRDPTKFYLLIVLSYSVLIPFSINSIYMLLKKHKKFSIVQFQNLFLLFTVLYLIFLIRPGVLGQLGGTFKSGSIPNEYVELKNFIVGKPEFFRTLWLPIQSRFRIQTENHPLINGDSIFKTSSSSEILKKLEDPETKERLARLSIKYIIIPYDSTSEIFLEDRRYDYSKRLKIEKDIDTVRWLKKIESGNITIYETPSYKDHFYYEDEARVSYTKINNSKYAINVSDNTSNLIFSEEFHPGWKALVGTTKINPNKTEEGTMSFNLPANRQVIIYFEPDVLAKYTYLFSFIFLVVVLIIITRGKRIYK